MGYKQYCKDYKNIENYEMAAADNFKGWECHHRLETHTPDGKRREVEIAAKELIALGMYYGRPAEELIFMKASEHKALRKPSEETKKKMSEAHKGNRNALGYKHSEEAKKKISEAMKCNRNALGLRLSEETKKKMSDAKKGNKNAEANRGKHWFNNGKENKFCFECPPGFVPGMLK